MDHIFEFYTERHVENIWGYRPRFMYSKSEKHLFLGEVPFGFNDLTLKFGLRDIRARYYFLPYKNYDNFIGTFGPSIDIIAPTGNHEHRLGKGRWIISPGLNLGLIASDWIQFFPILSYQYISKPMFEHDSRYEPGASHGMTFRTIIPIVFHEYFFIHVTPIYTVNDVSEVKESRYIQELFGSWAIQEKLQVTGHWRGNFKDRINTVSLGFTVFF